MPEPVTVETPPSSDVAASVPLTRYASVTTDGVTVDSNTQTEPELREALADATATTADIERNDDGTFKTKAGKPRDDPRARMLEATAKEAAAKRERDEARAESARLRTELDAARRPAAPAPSEVRSPESAAPATPAADDPEPKELDFEDYRAFVKAQARWEARQEFREQTAKAQQATQRTAAEQAHHARETTWQGRLQEARTKDPTFETRIKPETPISAPMQFVIKESPVGIELLTWLSDHQDESQRLSTLHPAEVLREMGKLEARLEAASPAAAQPPVVPAVSHAKPPIKPLGSSPHISDTEPGDDASDDEWLRYQQRRSRQK